MFKNLFYSCIPKTLKNFVKDFVKIVQEKFNEIPSDQEIASQECKQSQIKNQVIETLEKVILDIKTLK